MQCMATARTQHLDIYASRVFHARVLNCLFAITTTIADRFICFLLSKTKQSHNHIYAFNMKAASINILLLLVFAAAATTAAGIRRILLYSQHRRNPVCVLPDIGYSSDRTAVARSRDSGRRRRRGLSQAEWELSTCHIPRADISQHSCRIQCSSQCRPPDTISLPCLYTSVNNIQIKNDEKILNR